MYILIAILYEGNNTLFLLTNRNIINIFLNVVVIKITKYI